jgi:hypothetical protein
MRIRSTLFCLLLSGLLLAGCGGGGGGGGDDEIDTTTVQLDWTANREAAVNRAGGGYRIYYSTVQGFALADATMVDVPYQAGDQAPTSAALELEPGTYYFRITAYSGLNPDGSEASQEATLVVP